MKVQTISKIKSYCKELGYNSRFFENVAIIYTGIDEWTIQEKESHKGTRYFIKHINIVGNSTGKHHYHKQRVAKDIDFIFNNIIAPHCAFLTVYNEVFKVNSLLKAISC